MKRKTLKTIVWTAVITCILTLIGVFMFNQGCPGERIREVRLVDTISVKALIRDTVLRWHEKLVYRDVEPETVYLSVETLLVDTVWESWPEAIVYLSKKGSRLDFVSLIPIDSQLNAAQIKRYKHDVSEDFTIRAKGEGFSVMIKRGFWTRFYGGVSGGLGFKVWADTTIPFVEPYVKAYVGWGPVNVGPRINTHGIVLEAEATWRF